MGMASLQLIREAAEKIATLVDDDTFLPDMGIITFLVAGSTVGKSGMMLFLSLVLLFATLVIAESFVCLFVPPMRADSERGGEREREREHSEDR